MHSGILVIFVLAVCSPVININGFMCACLYGQLERVVTFIPFMIRNVHIILGPRNNSVAF